MTTARSRAQLATVLFLLVASACDPPADSTPEGEPDVAMPAPGCAYSPRGPLVECTPPAPLAEPACAVEYEGDSWGWRHFDGEGRQIARGSQYFGVDTVARQVDPDGTERWFEQSIDVDGCLEWTIERVVRSDQAFKRSRDRDGEECRVEETYADEIVRHTIDPGCDCRDVRVARDCAFGPHGLERCVGTNSDGSSYVETWAYGPSGRLMEEAYARDDFAYRQRYDAEGRRIELLEESRRRDQPMTTTRYTWTYEAPHREIRRVDEHDDGVIDWTYRQDFDDLDRQVLYEVEHDGQMTLRKTTTYADDGGRRVVEEREDSTIVRLRTVAEDGFTERVEINGEESEFTAVRVDDEHRTREYFYRHHHFPSPRIYHVLSAHDERDRVTSERVRSVYNGRERRCTTAFTWSGPCPVVPGSYIGSGCP